MTSASKVIGFFLFFACLLMGASYAEDCSEALRTLQTKIAEQLKTAEGAQAISTKALVDARAICMLEPGSEICEQMRQAYIKAQKHANAAQASLESLKQEMEELKRRCNG